MTQATATRIDEPPVRPARSFSMPDVAILAAACALLFVGLGTRSLWYLEGRWAEVTREMFLTRDFFHPTIGGEPYFDKPLLTYWLVAAVSALTGRLDEWATRVPSAVSGIITIAATMWLGRRLWSAKAGRVAGAILLTSHGFLFWCRTANADAENLAAIMLAIAWYWGHRDRPNFTSFLGFYLIVFVGALMKGLPAVVIPVLAILPDIVVHKRWRQVLTPAHVLAAIIGLAIYLVPFWYASHTNPSTYQANGLALVFRENVVRFFRPFDHKGPVYLYLYVWPEFLLPWAPLFVAAVIGLLTAWKRLDANTRWLLYAAAVIFAFFTISGSRRNYYVLPLLPFASLMIAVFAVELSDVRVQAIRRWGMLVQIVLIVVVVALEIAAAGLYGTIESRAGFALPRELRISMLITGIAVAVVGLGLSFYSHRMGIRSNRQFWAMVAVSAVTLGGFFCWQQGVLEVFRSERPFARELRPHIAALPPKHVGFYRTFSADMLFYLDMREHPAVLRNAKELRAFLSREGTNAVLTQREYVGDAGNNWPERLSARPDFAQQCQPWQKEPPNAYWVAWIVQSPAGNPTR